MSLSIEQLRSAFKKEESQSNRPNNYYPFWNMKVGDQAMVRFLPDANSENPLGFMVEKLQHTLIINGERKTVPCLKMYGETDCPICKVSSAYYKSDDKENGKKYWRNKQHLVQALIVEDPLDPDTETKENSEGKVMVLALGYQLFNIIKEAFESGELDEIPYAYKDGCNFIIKKSKQGEYDTYAVGSKFARKSSSLDDDEIAFVEDNLLDLSTLLPAHPTHEKLEAMLEAEMTGGNYNEAEDEDEDDNSSETSSVTPKKSVPKKANKKSAKLEDKKDDVDNDDATDDDADNNDNEYGDEAEDILAKIRNRRRAA